ncbi:hypothetical protein [Streptomyces sp. t39]|uniref:hypothetical protein n=1 Tax=Streptomyces sp. t39 TaxID=1828156 RepID=UPI0011CEA2C1|nr:hypothetical protein [Streptomyces sp. t39]TXS50137.1 hypothetical protein EAO77_27905 [Streptomyces sp. t39]
MTQLHWRPADVKLNEKLVPNPRAEHDLLSDLTAVHVAIDGSFLHIDPYIGAPAAHGQVEYPITVVPASAVQRLTYKAGIKSEVPEIDVRVG